MRKTASTGTRRRPRLIIGASAVAAVSLALAACSSGTTSSGGGTTGTTGGGQNSAVSSKYPWCGPKQASIALADGFGDNTWRELTRYSAVTIAAECPSVTKYVYDNGEGNTQKAIGDINSLVAQGITAIVDFPDAGEAMLPALTKAYQAGTIVVPYRVSPGGTAGQNYNAYLSTDFTSAGVLWGQDVATALKGQGNVVFLGGPPANSQSLEEYQGMQKVLTSCPGIHFIGQTPYNVTNWDPAQTQKVVTAILAKYPKIDAITTDFGAALASSFGAFAQAGRQIPAVATEDSNLLSCDRQKQVKSDPQFQLFTVDSQNWMARTAVDFAVAKASGGQVPSSPVVPQKAFEDSLTGQPHPVQCDPSMPSDAFLSSHLSHPAQRAALGE